jgi:hypothetical protein
MLRRVQTVTAGASAICGPRPAVWNSIKDENPPPVPLPAGLAETMEGALNVSPTQKMILAWAGSMPQADRFQRSQTRWSPHSIEAVSLRI